MENKLNKYGLYDLSKVSKSEIEIKQIYNRIVKPLTVFAPYLHEDATFATFNMEHEKSVTSDDNTINIKINSNLTEEPKSLENFLEKIKALIKSKEQSYLTLNEQTELINIILQEVKLKFKDIITIPQEPLLNEKLNSELRRNIFGYVINICNDLFHEYIKKAEIFKAREIFSNEANMTRLKSLLLIDLKKTINIHSIKSKLVTIFKKMIKENHNYDTLPINFNNKKFIDLKNEFEESVISKKGKNRIRSENIKEILDRMPVIEYKSLEKILQTTYMTKKTGEKLKRKNTLFDFKRELQRTPKNIGKSRDLTDIELLSRIENENFSIMNLKKCESMPFLFDTKLDEEFKGEPIVEKYKTTDSINIILNFGFKENDSDLLTNRDLKNNDVNKIPINIKEDLKSLLCRTTKSYDKSDEGPALLMTLMSKSQHTQIMEKLNNKIKAIDDKYKRFNEEIKLHSKENIHPQPATVDTQFFNQFDLKVSDIRVTTRNLQSSVSVQAYGPLYNELNKEIDSDMVKQLDSDLSVGDEIKKVYNELLKTINENYLLFNIDEYVQQTPENLDYKSSFLSSILIKDGPSKCINNNLKYAKYNEAPWHNCNYREWNKTPLVDVIDPSAHSYRPTKGKKKLIKAMEIDIGKINSIDNKEIKNLDSKEYKIWLKWWKDNYSTGDYFKYLSQEGTDFLGRIFHLYDENQNNDLNISEEEMINIKNMEKAEIEKENLIEQLKNKKNFFETDMWNPETVLLGGLGKDPVLDDEINPLKIYEKSIQRPKTSTLKIDLFKPLENKIQNRKEHEMQSVINEKIEIHKSPQQRLERIWTLLNMPESERLEMVIKYCSDKYFPQITEAIEAWEKIAELISEREKYIYELEVFEKDASDPNRFFLKSSIGRLKEAKFRDACYKKIDNLEDDIKKLRNELKIKYNDLVTYNGREYLDKMKYDRIEMLHWLQEERRKKYFETDTKN